ncbi:hypothetical protein [Burkholderia multivorans]|uniref:hypothetical protein n=1 Tax=Burkholderia multivorans TaxID=87883 RepID=UPI000F4DC835|nr:hypothetical protein [Burkholderia multivorans]MCA8438812.1 hypothetical protein [Burkholderia multivorans]
MDRFTCTGPLQAQLAQIVNGGIIVGDGREYNRECLKAQSMDLVYSLLVMIRAREESDTKSKRVKAAIRRQRQGSIAGTWRAPIRVGKNPQWVREYESGGFEPPDDRAAAVSCPHRNVQTGTRPSPDRPRARRPLAQDYRQRPLDVEPHLPAAGEPDADRREVGRGRRANVPARSVNGNLQARTRKSSLPHNALINSHNAHTPLYDALLK